MRSTFLVSPVVVNFVMDKDPSIPEETRSIGNIAREQFSKTKEERRKLIQIQSLTEASHCPKERSWIRKQKTSELEINLCGDLTED
ncbi:hypothetical protein Tco_1555631 [Tanacetum coccineum]